LQRVYSAENAFDARLVCDRLNEAGIPAKVHGILLTGALGELPMDTAPTVWIEDGDQYDPARRLIQAFEHRTPAGARWRCGHCREINEPAFEICWACGHEPPA
jgi:hypothetical protein